jgi:hypothetical protein
MSTSSRYGTWISATPFFIAQNRQVPEPASAALFGIGILEMLTLRRRTNHEGDGLAFGMKLEIDPDRDVSTAGESRPRACAFW